MLHKIKRQDCIAKYDKLPLSKIDFEKDEEEIFYPKTFKSHVLVLPAKSFRGLASALGKELSKLADALHTESFTFLGETDTPWLSQNNDYNPVQVARRYLMDNNVGQRFNGGLQVQALELPVFIKHLVWFTRCNAGLPYVYFVDAVQNILGTICQYGNLHLDVLNEQAVSQVESYISHSNFERGDRSSCHNRFSRISTIPGREIML